MNPEEKVNELETEVDGLQTELERVRREKRQIPAPNEENTDLVTYVGEEKSLQ